MLLDNKTAVIYGAGGAVGSAVARAFAREGAWVFLTGHHLANVEAIAQDIIATGGRAVTARVDSLDERSVFIHQGGYNSPQAFTDGFRRRSGWEQVSRRSA